MLPAAGEGARQRATLRGELDAGMAKPLAVAPRFLANGLRPRGVYFPRSSSSSRRIASSARFGSSGSTCAGITLFDPHTFGPGPGDRVMERSRPRRTAELRRIWRWVRRVHWTAQIVLMLGAVAIAAMLVCAFNCIRRVRSRCGRLYGSS
jgi:hypothetical protein